MMAYRARNRPGIQILLLTASLGMNIYLWTHAGQGITMYNTDLSRSEVYTTGAEDWSKHKLIKQLCNVHSNWTNFLITPTSPTNLQHWGFTDKVKCPAFDINKYPKNRQKVSLDCKSNPPKFMTSWTTSSNDIHSVPFGDKCLTGAIENCCKDSNPVPNVVHYIWYANKSLGFFQFVSFMSVLRFMRPCLILIHGNFLPYGRYWDYFVSISPNIVHVNRTKPNSVFGHKLAYSEHASDIMRIEGLKLYGGVYVDFDEILLRPLEPLRKYEYTQGHEMSHTLGSQLVMAAKNATFLHHWYLGYRDNYKRSWAYNALWVPAIIARNHSELIHVEGFNFTRPNWQNVKKIFHQNYDWSTNYGMHLYVRWYKNATDPKIVRTLNTTLGSVSRHVLFGNKELCLN